MDKLEASLLLITKFFYINFSLDFQLHLNYVNIIFWKIVKIFV